MKILRFILLLTFTVFSANAQAPIAIGGSVIDAHGDAVAGAAVRCGSETVVTDSDGKFAFVSARCGQFVVSAGGFETAIIDAATDSKIVLRPSSLFGNVTVSGVSTRLVDTPSSVVVVDRSMLDSSGTQTLDDRLRGVPGFSLFRRSGSKTANPTTQGASLRGVGASGASRAVVLKDGVPLNDPFGSWVYWGRVPSESISEVEIIRGPASDLYGTAAVGGVISVRTREIDAAPFASIDLSYGSQQTPFGSGFSSGRWGKWGGSLAGEYLKTDGYIPVAPEQRGAVDTLANVRRSSIVPTGERKLGENSRVFASAEFYREMRANGTPQQRNDTQINNVVAGADIALKRAGALTLRAFGGTENYDQTFSAIAANRQTESLNRLQTVPSQNLGLSGRWTFSHAANTYFAGGEYRNIRGRSDEIGIANGNPTVATSAGGRESSAAAYGGFLYRPFDRLTLSGGLRYDRWNETHGFSASRSLVTPAFSLTSFPDRDRSAVSPRGSLLFRVNRNISLAASASGGFRQPTLNELYRSFRVGNVLTLSNENLRAESAVNGEGAVVISAFDERLYLRAGPFCTRVTDTVSNVTLTITPTLITRQRQNVGITQSCGFEADSMVRATPTFSIRAGYLHVNAKVLEMPGNGALVGLKLPQVPSDQGTVQARYSREDLGTFSVQLRASGPQFDDDQNQLPLKGYAAFDVFASHDLGRRTSLYFAGENIFNTHIEAGRTPVLTLAQPRTVRVGLRFKFGRN